MVGMVLAVAAPAPAVKVMRVTLSPLKSLRWVSVSLGGAVLSPDSKSAPGSLLRCPPAPDACNPPTCPAPGSGGSREVRGHPAGRAGGDREAEGGAGGQGGRRGALQAGGGGVAPSPGKEGRGGRSSARPSNPLARRPLPDLRRSDLSPLPLPSHNNTPTLAPGLTLALTRLRTREPLKLVLPWMRNPTNGDVCGRRLPE